MSGRSKATIVKAAAVSLTLLLAGCGSGGGGGDDSAEFTFKLAGSFPKGHVIAKNLPQKYMENVEKASNGRIDFKYFPAEQLGKAEDMLDLVNGGVADIAYIAPQYYSGKLPLGTISGIPGIYPSSVVGAPAFYKLVRTKLYKAEIKKHKLQPLFSFVTGAYQVATKQKKVASPDDLSGLHIRTSGGHMELTAKKMGAVPVSLAAPEMYQAMQRGTVDGTFISPESMKAYHLDRLVNYLTTNLALGGFGAYFAMNQGNWEQLPEDLQKIMIEEGKKVSISGGKALNAAKEKYVKEFKKAGMNLVEVPKTDVAKFDQVAGSVQQAWVADMQGRGLPGKEILAEMKRLVGKHK